MNNLCLGHIHKNNMLHNRNPGRSFRTIGESEDRIAFSQFFIEGLRPQDGSS